MGVWLNAHPAASLSAQQWPLDRITLVVLPAFWMLAANEANRGIGDVLFVIGATLPANVLCYLLVGSLAWLGLKKHWLFFVPLVLMVSLWFWYVWHLR